MFGTRDNDPRPERVITVMTLMTFMTHNLTKHMLCRRRGHRVRRVSRQTPMQRGPGAATMRRMSRSCCVCVSSPTMWTQP